MSPNPEAPPIDDAPAGGPVAADGGDDVVVSVTEAAREVVLGIRAEEDDPESLALRIEVTGTKGVDFTYDLAFEAIAAAAEGDSVAVVDGLAVMVPAGSIDSLRGATLDVPASSGQGGLVIRNPNRPDPLAGLDLELTGDVAERVQQLLEQAINPMLASHGGFASLLGVDGTRVFLTMGGGCQGCAMSRMTLTEGIQAQILAAIPEVTEVVDATDHAAGENPFYS